ncbi:hypothetical protein [Pseudoduganella violaceinigra]|uniref:hypothetical protein n=1 Tax=Pseudoduganella violaceinigra TaxID=246602 RepID=UPI0012B6013E|nr:hypothetical protein [Pseudoduganella violaceinigra]
MMSEEIRPYGTAETLWMVFSLLLLDPTRQVETLGGLPNNGNNNALSLRENAAVNLIGTIQDFYGGCIWEFEPCPIALELFELVDSLDKAIV